ncbi:AAA family ATPase [Stenotrophomonas sp. AS1]|uniref:AAA family ATPase n=1 Tax=Stenotrophomonas sp. AS1 TaxID=3029188 RepID=UPI003B810B2D
MNSQVTFDSIKVHAGQVFTPGSPVNAMDLFAGRIDQLQKISDAVSQRGYHAVLFGERGVGKTSLSNILIQVMQGNGFIVTKVNCDAQDTFDSIWRKAFRDITYTKQVAAPGFLQTITAQVTSIAAALPSEITPDDVRRTLAELGTQANILVVLDEYDRLDPSSNSRTLISDTIKGLSDFGVNASLLLIGVADSVNDLVAGHLSIERALVQIPMPRMSSEEIAMIVDNGMARLNMTIDAGGKSHLVHLAQGVPYIAHLLALYSTRSALSAQSMHIERSHVDEGINKSLEQWNQSIRTAYYDAVKSAQPGNIYKEVLLACALAEIDEMGYFAAAAVRGPLREITGRPLDIPNFSSHLKQFSEAIRGGILERVGVARRLRYRFVSPLMKPYIIMRGYADRLV